MVGVDSKNRCSILAESKTGRCQRPLANAAPAILTAQTPVDGSPYVFSSDEDFATSYQGTRRYWWKAVQIAELPGVTPHTLRHTIGSAAVSSGGSQPLIRAIFGRANQQSTSVYAHNQGDPARRAADRDGAGGADRGGKNSTSQVNLTGQSRHVAPHGL